MLPLIAAILSAPPGAEAAPQFPLTFEGTMCETLTGICNPITFVLNANGTIREPNLGWDGTWTYNKNNGKFKAPMQDWYSHLFQGFRTPTGACVDGEYVTIIPGMYGTFTICMVP